MSEIKENQPMQEYLDDPAIGSSGVKKFRDTPKDYWYDKKGPKEKDSRPLYFGTMAHVWMIERHKFADEYMVAPDWGPLNKNPGAGKWREFKRQAEELGKKPVSHKDGFWLKCLTEEIERHDDLKEILSKCKAEVSFYADIDGVRFKSREDLWQFEDGIVWDVKTSKDDITDESQIRSVIWKHKYHLSAAHHMSVMRACGVDVKGWGWIFVKSTGYPHIVVAKCDQETLDCGQKDFESAVKKIKICLDKDDWPGVETGIIETGLPYYVHDTFY
jgi:exodeoxyribonuclease VIII